MYFLISEEIIHLSLTVKLETQTMRNLRCAVESSNSLGRPLTELLETLQYQNPKHSYAILPVSFPQKPCMQRLSSSSRNQTMTLFAFP